ncbi:HalOD1 output domain-containing protein [Natrarchaeobaculum sulfurireducens]|uniref:Halobacterial output domain-containing protein n=1 Tax=Natrarchaeobaculum sulfurireducens TaxID=2044521 RepID=A0A346PJR1_9EURY|nr:HalOD1 output domain-containing protein [Natrarchaeobaculum sulfurireducens]AXR79756.1 hypothetical protein AArc1_3463 [Natrarchaeobaculum sulfurireducens]
MSTRHCNWDGELPSVAVVRAIADLEGVDPLDLPTTHVGRLIEHVHPDALDVLVTETDEVVVSFSVNGYHVEIDDAELTVIER